MRRLSVFASVLSAAVLVAACFPSHFTSTRVGAMYFAKPDDCAIAFENADFSAASSKYTHIGMVTITGPDAATWNEQIQAKVRTEACRMGGEIVTLNAASAQAVAAASMTQFMVWVRPPPPAPNAPATP